MVRYLSLCTAMLLVCSRCSSSVALGVRYAHALAYAQSRRVTMMRPYQSLGFVASSLNAAFYSSRAGRPEITGINSRMPPTTTTTTITTRHVSSTSARQKIFSLNGYRTLGKSRRPYSSTPINGRPTTTMVASALSTAMPTAPQTTLSRPTGAARLNFIDFNPEVLMAGPAVLTPVVIMHGLLGNSRNFQGWGAKLVKSLDKERRVFAVDMRNHGASTHHDSMTYVNMADDVLGFLADQGLTEAVLIGHSMGGKAAAMTALLHPHAVKGLIMMDIAPVSYSMVDATNWGETQKIIEAIHNLSLDGVDSRRDADELLAKDIVDPALRAFAVTNLEKNPVSGRQEWRINVAAIHRSMGDLAQFDSGKGDEGTLRRLGAHEGKPLPPYQGDALFVAGGNSRYIRSQHLGEIRKLFPTFVLSTIKGAGHWVHADNPTETLRLAKSFLDRPELG